MGAAMKRYDIVVKDRQLACVPIQSPLRPMGVIKG
jgi:RNA-splicing ligase RtcB